MKKTLWEHLISLWKVASVRENLAHSWESVTLFHLCFGQWHLERHASSSCPVTFAVAQSGVLKWGQISPITVQRTSQETFSRHLCFIFFSLPLGHMGQIKVVWWFEPSGLNQHPGANTGQVAGVLEELVQTETLSVKWFHVTPRLIFAGSCGRAGRKERTPFLRLPTPSSAFYKWLNKPGKSKEKLNYCSSKLPIAGIHFFRVLAF